MGGGRDGGEVRKVRPYTVDYRSQIEGDITKASVDFIQRQAKAKQPFFTTPPASPSQM